MSPKFEITVDTSAYDESTLPESMRPAKFVTKVNGHSYASSRESASDAITKAVAMLSEELGNVDAQSLFEAMAAEGDFAKSAYARTKAATA
jgi:hypothetical protein